ncbi:hypothetical protein BB776_03770 [Planococcus salinarum]|uniref:DUF1828 domain-containing protein n=1 Tax=Planococcus salinarum TaxID=622695 RepID=A0ABX3D0C7_9BACL|nr:hypothetical protein [Planococcus salinarum]OHX51008.1 hypothetical protein BB776_03770 [Planococcus salinarum]TAA72903.1 hypothetical protein D2909_03680 [Planococcus salinarum]
MENVYVLRIPDLQQVLKQEDIAVWELFLLTDEKRYEKIRFQVSREGGCFTFTNIQACNGMLATIQIDFDHQTIVFNYGGNDTNEFVHFLFSALSQLFVKVDTERIQFMATAQKPRIRRPGTRR